MGKLIVIEGLDGSGKATQSELLYQYLLSLGKKAVKISFPDYDSPSSQPIKMYLAGEFGASADDVNAYAASSFYAVDRYASFKCKWEKLYNDDYIIVADRYTTSNGVHQCSKLKNEDWQLFMDWLYDFEYNKIGIPKPYMTIYLDMSPEVSQRLISARYEGDEAKKDIHEKDFDYLFRSRKAAQFCIEHGAWEKIDCDNGELPLSIEEIFLSIKRKIDIIL